MNDSKVKNITIIGVLTALICVAAPFSIPLPFTPTPISFANLAIYFSACILGAKKSTLSVLIYLLIGSIGLPVFAGFSGGLSGIAGPTGGYLIGFLFMAFISGLFIEKFENKIYICIIGMILGTAVCYLFGTAWLSMQLKLSFNKALVMGVFPFIPGDLIKIIVASIVGIKVRKRLELLNLI
ncbi:biotin transporter BioY [Clostridium sp. BJN0001]|uniref:biotin transporter BioY n=1 Tax=Clostridium sp. BJN0001 TaxID=2930219 RepID=UPI001FCF7F9F|nr:biotin transporter BioY [Clostridium sp. BJN0001]